MDAHDMKFFGGFGIGIMIAGDGWIQVFGLALALGAAAVMVFLPKESR